jgi:transcription initiation protein SPT3
MFVFGEVQDPDPLTVNLVEDIVRSQVIELVRHIMCVLSPQ